MKLGIGRAKPKSTLISSALAELFGVVHADDAIGTPASDLREATEHFADGALILVFRAVLVLYFLLKTQGASFGAVRTFAVHHFA